MKEDLYDDLYEEKEEKIDFHALLFRYVIRWPWFVASVIICLAGAWLHLRQTTPVYNISASVIIKDDKKGGNSGGNLAALEGLGLVNSVSNIDNEIEILRSKTLVKHVVSELNLYTTYSVKGSFNEVELYKSSPVLVGLTPQEADRLPGPAVFELTLSPGNRLDVKATVGETSYNKRFSKLPGLLVTPAGTFTFTLAGDSAGVSEPQTLTAVVSNPMQTAKRYAAALSVEPTSKTTSIVIVSLKNTNKRRGEDFINRLIEVYNRNTNNDKNEVAEKTEEFIAGRIRIINDELFSTEKELETFKRDAGLTDLASDAQLAVSENSAYEKQRVENGTQLNLVRYLAEYISAPDKINAVLPVNVGLTDQSLSSLIGQYNEMVLQRNRLLRNSSESNPVIVNLDSGIRAMRENILTTIHSVQKGLLITKADLDRQASKFNRRISNAPAQERQFVSISRQQEIKAGLYLMLLQKREENSIALAATANNAKIVDEAMADNGPVSPKTKTIYMIALVMGMGIPVAIIYAMGLLQFRIEGRADVEKLTSAPIIGDIPLAEEGNGKAGGIAVRENENSLMAETFRGIRTNLQFMLGEENKVILVTSTISGEGKTFVATNLAISLSLLGKRVVIVGLDIRKPGLNKVFNLSQKEKGITQFLAGPQTTDLMSMVQPSGISRTLSILPGGTVPPNPTELLARQALVEAIDILKKHFDYIVLDTAPIGMVTDTQIIARVADLSVYVCRADYTHKADYTLLEDLRLGNKLPNLCTVINGLDMKKRKYGYYYGYGKYGHYYGYGKKYGYGYGYGQKHN